VPIRKGRQVHKRTQTNAFPAHGGANSISTLESNLHLMHANYLSLCERAHKTSRVSLGAAMADGQFVAAIV
jgi:hypothetical protein